VASRPRKATTASARVEQPRPGEADTVSVAPHQLLSLFLAKDLEALIDVVFQVMATSVACDFVSAVYRNVGDGLLRERDSRGRDYDTAFMRRYAELTPALPLVLANPGIKTLTTRTGLSGPTRELRRTAFYREIMRPQGWRHGVSLCFWGDQPGNLPILVAVAYRREGQRDFSERDVRTLQHTHPFIDGAVNRIYEREAEKTLHEGIQMAARSGALGCAILDRNLLPVVVNGAAGQLCAAWLNDGAATDEDLSPSAWRLPPALAAECQALHEEWHKFLRAEPRAMALRHHRRVVHSRVPELTALITIIRPAATGFAEPMFVVELDRRVHGVPLNTPDLPVSLLRQMTAAERAVAIVLADGFSNQDIADRLGKSVQAVKFLLHKIYEKSGIRNRAALVAVLRSRQNSRNRAAGTASRSAGPKVK
jgi:DNA-binding CsgD family transcriptional regulator